MDPIVQAEYLVRLGVALLLSGVLGWDRERLNRPAGIRTHMTVGMSAALFFVLAEALMIRYGDLSTVRWDPTRTLQAIVAGVSFLGAGTIFVNRRFRGQPEGLTTAAGLLATCGVGVAAGVEAYVLAGGATVLQLVVLWLFRSLPIRESADPATSTGTPPVHARDSSVARQDA